MVYTWPLSTHLTTHIPGEEAIVDLGRDPALQSWYFWRTRTALTSGDEDLLYSRLVHHPHGMEMTLQPNMVWQAALSLLFPGVAVHTALNLILLLSFVSSGVAAYVLGRHVSRHEAGALLCGFIFAFCPYRMQHLVGHYQLMATATLPLVLWTCLRLFEAPSRRRIIEAAVMLGITVLTDYYTFAYALLLVGWLTMARLVANWRDRSSMLSILRHAALVGVGAFLVASPILIPALHSASLSGYAALPGHEKHKADLLSFVVPSARQWLFSPLQSGFEQWLNMDAIDGVEHSVYLGIGLIALLLVGRRLLWREAATRHIALMAGVFAVLALGPGLSVGGVNEITWAGWTITLPLPGSILADLPFFESARAPGRAIVVVMLALAACASVSLRHLLQRGGVWARIDGRIVAAVVCGLLALEYVVPISLARVDKPHGIELLANDPGPVAHAPLYPVRAGLAQVWHEQPILLPSLGRTDPAVRQYYWRHEALRQLTMPDAVLDPEVAARAVDLLGLRHIVWDRRVFLGANDRVLAALGAGWGMRTIYSDPTITVQRTDRPRFVAQSVAFDVSEPASDLHLLYGWSNRQPYGQHHTSWLLRREAQIVLPAVQSGDYRLRLSLLALLKEGTSSALHVRLQDGTVSSHPLQRGVNDIEVSINDGHLSAARPNVVTLIPAEDVDRPHRTEAGAIERGHAGVLVRSGGLWTAHEGRALITTGGKAVAATRVGILVAAIEPRSGQLLSYKLFPSQPTAQPVALLRNYIDSLPEQATVAVAVRSSPLVEGGNLADALQSLGVAADLRIGRFNSLALIGWRDGRPPVLSTGAVEAAVGVGPIPAQAQLSLGLLHLALVSDR